MRGAVLALTAGLMASAAVAAVPGLEPGVSRELAQWRAKHYRDVRYALAISVTAGATKLAGTTTVEVTLSPTVPDLVLDWRTSPGAAPVVQLRVNGKRVKAKLEREHLIVPARLLRAGRNRIRLSFESPIALSGSAVTRYVDREDSSEYVYTLFVPSDATSPTLKRVSASSWSCRAHGPPSETLRSRQRRRCRAACAGSDSPRPRRSARISSPLPLGRSRRSRFPPRPNPLPRGARRRERGRPPKGVRVLPPRKRRPKRGSSFASRSSRAPARRPPTSYGSIASRCAGSSATSIRAFRFPSTIWCSSRSSPTGAWSTPGRPFYARMRCFFRPRPTKRTSSRARSSCSTRPRTSGSAILSPCAGSTTCG